MVTAAPLILVVMLMAGKHFIYHPVLMPSISPSVNLFVDGGVSLLPRREGGTEESGKKRRKKRRRKRETGRRKKEKIMNHGRKEKGI